MVLVFLVPPSFSNPLSGLPVDVRGRTWNRPRAEYAIGFAGSHQQGSGAASHCCLCAGMMP